MTWYGYLHQNGSLHVKRFFNAGDTAEATNSPFVRETVGPFNATTREEAMETLKAELNELGHAWFKEDD